MTDQELEKSIEYIYSLGVKQGIICSMRRLIELSREYNMPCLDNAAQFINTNQDLIIKYGHEQINFKGDRVSEGNRNVAEL